MSTASHHPHRGSRGPLGLGMVVAGLTVALGLVVVGPSSANAATADAASNTFVVYLVLPSGTAGESKSTATTVTREELSGFSLSTAAPARGPGGKAATPANSSATASMAINRASVQLLTSVAGASKLSLEVDFYNSGGGALVFSYKFTKATFTSYLLQDGSSGDSVQVTFAYQQLVVDYVSVDSPSPTYTIGKAAGS